MSEGNTSNEAKLGPQVSGGFRKLDVSVRETDYVAGRQNITAIVIRNTYPSNITLRSVLARNSILTSASKIAVFGEEKARARVRRESRTGFRFKIPNFIPGREHPIFEFSHQMERLSKAEPIRIAADAGSKVSIDAEAAAGREILIAAGSSAEVHLVSPKESEDEKRRDKIITPMSEVVAEYTWKTTHWLLFTPARLGIDIEVKYEIDSEVRSQVVSSTFDIKPPIVSIIIGSICGGVIGSLARSLTVSGEFNITWRLIVQVVGSILLAVMATIALSRKSGTQAFITVEDFFGAFVLGSLIGYEGTSFFEKSVAGIEASGISNTAGK